VSESSRLGLGHMTARSTTRMADERRLTGTAYRIRRVEYLPSQMTSRGARCGPFVRAGGSAIVCTLCASDETVEANQSPLVDLTRRPSHCGTDRSPGLTRHCRPPFVGAGTPSGAARSVGAANGCCAHPVGRHPTAASRTRAERSVHCVAGAAPIGADYACAFARAARTRSATPPRSCMTRMRVMRPSSMSNTHAHSARCVAPLALTVNVSVLMVTTRLPSP
jgi:hypothetical protein